MEMAYRERWKEEIAAMRRVLAGLAMKEECKWGKPTYTVDGKNIVILQGFKEYFALGFFQGALLKEDRKSTRLNSSHLGISYAVFCLKKKNKKTNDIIIR